VCDQVLGDILAEVNIARRLGTQLSEIFNTHRLSHTQTITNIINILFELGAFTIFLYSHERSEKLVVKLFLYLSLQIP
jgi:hypothetical protein